MIWHLLYDTQSGANLGTLYQARNFLNARSVPKSPMKDINACEELLLKYCESLTIAAYNQLTEQFDVSSTDNEEENKKLFDNILDNLVDGFVMSKVPEIPSDGLFSCIWCDKKYKLMKSLKNHQINNHQHKEDKINESSDDHVLNYSHNALALCYLAKDFIDARKHGDGKRIIRLHKSLLLYFKLDGRTKYSFQTLHLLSQINFLLPPGLSHELMWNRSVNNAGKVDSNVELDRELEHRNKYAKNELHHFQGKITENSIRRCSESYDEMVKIMNAFDEEVSAFKPSGRHTIPNWKEDVNELAEQYTALKLFSFVNGREHSCFPRYPENCLGRLNMMNFKKWVYAKLKQYSEMNIYKHDHIFT